MTECLIIGSGIVGLVTAYELRKSGCKITVIESQRSGQASKSAAGILFPINKHTYHCLSQPLNLPLL